MSLYDIEIQPSAPVPSLAVAMAKPPVAPPEKNAPTCELFERALAVNSRLLGSDAVQDQYAKAMKASLVRVPDSDQTRSAPEFDMREIHQQVVGALADGETKDSNGLRAAARGLAMGRFRIYIGSDLARAEIDRKKRPGDGKSFYRLAGLGGPIVPPKNPFGRSGMQRPILEELSKSDKPLSARDMHDLGHGVVRSSCLGALDSLLAKGFVEVAPVYKPKAYRITDAGRGALV